MELGGDFILGVHSCAVNATLSHALRDPEIMQRFKYRSTSDKVNLQQKVVISTTFWKSDHITIFTIHNDCGPVRLLRISYTYYTYMLHEEEEEEEER